MTEPTQRLPPFDPKVLEVLATGDEKTLVMAVASYAAALVAQAQLRPPVYATHLVSLPPLLAGKAASGLDLMRLLAHAPQGRQALRDLGLEPFLQHVDPS